MNYPKDFNQCPVCGSKQRLIEEEVNREITAGRLPKDSRVPALISQSTLFAPNSKLIVKRGVPVLVGFYDVCAACGCLYCVHMEKGVGMIEPQIGHVPPPGGNTPLGFGKG